MRFMIIRKSDALTEAGKMPGTAILGAMGKYMQDMQDAGILLGGEGLQPSSRGAKVKFEKGKATVTDGPFTEAKELIAGYSMIEVPSLADAIAWAQRWPAGAADTEENVELEIRQVFEAEDFGEEFTPAQRAAEEKMRAELAAKQR